MTGFIPGLLLLLNMSPVLNRPISPPSQLRLDVKLIVLATYCDQFHSDTLWEVILKSKSFYQMGKLKPIALAWLQTDRKVQTTVISANFT